MVNRRYAGGLILSLALSTPLGAAPPTTAIIGTPPQPGWSLLNTQQQVILAPLAAEWDKLDNLGRKKWLGIAERYPGLNKDEQRRVQDRMREWVSLTPEQRTRARDTYKEFNQLPSEQKQAVKQKWEAYSKLPPEEKQRVRQDGKSSRLLVPATVAEPPPVSENQVSGNIATTGEAPSPAPSDPATAGAATTPASPPPVDPGRN
jgi:Protein of unknown function (DUF3106)